MHNIQLALRNKLGDSLPYQIGEILIIFIVSISLIQLLDPIVKDNIILKQAVVWFANVIMLILVWYGSKLRGEGLDKFGLDVVQITWKKIGITFGYSILVFILATIGFIMGSIIMANITGVPESADMTSYAYLKDNVGMLILTLCGVYIVSSFGEEVIYRAFLINRLSDIFSGYKYSTWAVIVISAIIFGLVHYQWGAMGIVQTGFMGLVLAICYIKLKKRLWVLILAHAYMDTILMVQMYLASN